MMDTQKKYGGRPLVEEMFNSRRYVAAVPENPNGRWVWRAEFFGAFDYIDKYLLARGWHVIYCDCRDMFGSPAAVAAMKGFHDFIVPELHLDKAADINGFSRGGLYAFNYTLAHPDDIRTVYLDAPVLDFSTWLMGLSGAQRSDGDVRLLIEAYGFADESEAEAYNKKPVDRIGEFLSAGKPVLLIGGGADTAVPYMQNGAKLALELVKRGHNAMVIVKTDCGHHPHSVDPPDTAAAFIANN